MQYCLLIIVPFKEILSFRRCLLKRIVSSMDRLANQKRGKKKENKRKEEIFSNVPATNDSPALISY